MSAEQRFTLNCNASAARAKLNSAIRSTRFAIEAGASGRQLQELKASLEALTINLDSLNTVQDDILREANANQDPWLTSARVCPRVVFPPVSALEPVFRSQGQLKAQQPLGLEPVTVAIIAVGVAVSLFVVSTDGFKKSLLAIQGIGATADVAALTAQSALECIEEADGNPTALKVCADLSDPKRVEQLSRTAAAEGGPSLTTALIVGAAALAVYGIYRS